MSHKQQACNWNDQNMVEVTHSCQCIVVVRWTGPGWLCTRAVAFLVIFLQLYKLLHAYQTHCFKVVLLVPSNAKTDDRYKPSHSREDSQWKHELGKEQEPQWLLIKLCTYVIFLHNFVIAVQWLTACKQGYTDWHVEFPPPKSFSMQPVYCFQHLLSDCIRCIYCSSTWYWSNPRWGWF